MTFILDAILSFYEKVLCHGSLGLYLSLPVTHTTNLKQNVFLLLTLPLAFQSPEPPKLS